MTEPNPTAQHRKTRHAGMISAVELECGTIGQNEMTSRRMALQELTWKQKGRGQIMPNHTNKRF